MGSPRFFAFVKKQLTQVENAPSLLFKIFPLKKKGNTHAHSLQKHIQTKGRTILIIANLKMLPAAFFFFEEFPVLLKSLRESGKTATEAAKGK